MKIEYKKPTIEVVEMDLQAILAGSETRNQKGLDLPGGVEETNDDDEDDESFDNGQGGGIR